MKRLSMLLCLCFINLSYGDETPNQEVDCSNMLEMVTSSLNDGGDPNISSSLNGIDIGFDPYLMNGGATLLGNAVAARCVDVVQFLLDHGADPNMPCNDVTPLFAVFAMLAESNSIEDAARREEYRIPLRNIRDILVAHGAYSDGARRSRREFIREFRKYLSETSGSVIYALCDGNKIIFNDNGLTQQFDIPSDIRNYKVWLTFADILKPWIVSQKEIDNVHIVAIGVNNANFIMGRLQLLCKEQDIPVSLFIIPRDMPCDASALLELFTTHTNALTEEMMKRLDELCPGVRVNPFADSEAEFLAL